MEAERGVLRVMPGDVIEWEVEISSQSRVRHVWAVFEEETEDTSRRRLVLGGEVYRFEKSGEHRANFATLGYDEEYSDPPKVGTFRLSSINGTTSKGAQPDVLSETLPEIFIRIEDEPREEVLKLGETHLRVR